MMATRERPRQRQDADTEDDQFLAFENAFGLDADITDEDIEEFLLDQAEAEARTEEKAGFWNLQTGSGLALIAIGTIYLLQQLGFLGFGFSLAPFVALLPWLAGILIILTGFGVLSWSPARRRKKARRRARERRARQAKTAGRQTRAQRGSANRAAREASRTAEHRRERRSTRKRKLAKSRKDRKIAGVAAGIAHYLGIDPTLVRIAFVIGAIFGSGFSIPLYIILALVLPKDEDDEPGDEDAFIRVVRD